MQVDMRESKFKSVIIVDDDHEALMIHHKMVSLMGYHALSFNIPQDAINYLQRSSHEASLIITDYQMPEMSGLEMLEAIRASGTKAPALMISGNPEEICKIRAEKCGASIIGKPIRMKALANHIANCMAIDQPSATAALCCSSQGSFCKCC